MNKPSRIFVTGATGFVGRMLVARLLGEGFEVVAWCRSRERGRATLGKDVEIASPEQSSLEEALAGCDAVVNLQGENLFSGRWTAARKRRIESSRIEFTRELVDAMERLGSDRPSALVSASAIGYYGADVSEAVSENAPAVSAAA
jgi:NAD dependent epimerase/dehydratase family enzyme